MNGPKQINDSDPSRRLAAVQALAAAHPAIPRSDVYNLHMHTFYSFNCMDLSPSGVVAEAYRAGMMMAGMVDFDVLDGLDEFQKAARILNLRYMCSIETRTYVPAYAHAVINSPGEPGVAYHMGAGFTTATPDDGKAAAFLADMRKQAEVRNRALIDRVNAHTGKVRLSYDDDVTPLTPSGNATERHICLAYARKAREVFPDDDELRRYWADTLGSDKGLDELPDGPGFLNALRGRTMKQGGVGYVQPDAGSFPDMAAMNQFVLACGAIPTVAWLDGRSDGEKDPGAWLDHAMSLGTAAVNIIPDRNFTPGVKDDRLDNLHAFVRESEVRGLPVMIGTELNSPGQRLVDRFDAEELAPLLPVFMKGAMIMYGHTVLQQAAGLGYTSGWADKHFDTKEARNRFYEGIGRAIEPNTEAKLADVNDGWTPERISEAAGAEKAI